jgi:hypothetical protein
MFSMALGINVTMLLAALCYLVLIPVGFTLLKMKQQAVASLPLKQHA